MPTGLAADDRGRRGVKLMGCLGRLGMFVVGLVMTIAPCRDPAHRAGVRAGIRNG